MQPRPYQQTFIEKVEAGWKEFRKQLGVAPTGSGKTIIFSHLAKRLLDTTGKRTLILAHREELIDQAITKLRAATGIFAAKEKAEERASRQAPVVVASIQTMARRFDTWPADHFGLVVCDEAHHSISNSWATVLQYFDPHANIVGVTATPDRGDKRELGSYYENIAYEISLLDLIKQEYLCPITIKSLPIRIDLNDVHQTAGDFDAAELDHALTPYLKSIVEAVAREIGQRKTLAFLPLIATSRRFTSLCQEAGIKAEHVDGESPDRKSILDRYHNNEFQLLSNAMLLTEGYDEPAIGCIVPLRPTRSRPLYSQIVGRGTRMADNKPNLLLLDFLFLHEKHRLVRPANLIAKSDEEADSMTELAEKTAGEEQDLIELASEAEHEREKSLADRLKQLANRQARFISADEFALKHNSMVVAEYQPVMKWETDQISPSQRKWIEIAGVDPDSVRGKGHATKILDTYFRYKNSLPASSKQKYVMMKAGWMSADGLRGWKDATQGDARDFFAARR